MSYDVVDGSVHTDDKVPYGAAVKATGVLYLKSFMAPAVDLSACGGDIGTAIELIIGSIFLQSFIRSR